MFKLIAIETLQRHENLYRITEEMSDYQKRAVDLRLARYDSEKPALANYEYFMKRYTGCSDFTYVGDNPDKDFIAPNILGWKTICLKDYGRNIHKQDFSAVSNEALPNKMVMNISIIK